MNATSAIYRFWLNELCDVYIEGIKPIVDTEERSPVAMSAQESARDTLYTCLDTALRLLHPYMPFVTEELYQRLVRRPGDAVPSIMLTRYPAETQEWFSPEAEKEFEFVNSIVRCARSLMSDYGIKSNAKCMFSRKIYSTMLTD
jgi:valyl-tRNA synthetase